MFPQDVANQYYEAQRLYAEGKAPQALTILDAIEKHAPNHPEIMHARAICLHMAGNQKEALRLCNLLYTMHRDRRGLELRNKWSNPRTAGESSRPPSGAVTPVITTWNDAGAPGRKSGPVAPLEPLGRWFLHHCAVVCVDIDERPRPRPYMEDSDLPVALRKLGHTAEDLNAGIAQRYEQCLPHAARVVEVARRLKLPIIATHWGFRFEDGTDLDPETFNAMREEYGADANNWPGRLGDAQAYPAKLLGLRPSDYIAPKTSPDAFGSSNIRYVLYNLGVKHLVFVGGPVEAALGRTVATAKRRGFQTLCISDATYGTRESTRHAVLSEIGFDYRLDTAPFAALAEPPEA